eukprot:1414491-Rhodomonas_salina.1
MVMVMLLLLLLLLLPPGCDGRRSRLATVMCRCTMARGTTFAAWGQWWSKKLAGNPTPNVRNQFIGNVVAEGNRPGSQRGALGAHASQFSVAPFGAFNINGGYHGDQVPATQVSRPAFASLMVKVRGLSAYTPAMPCPILT